MNTVDNHGVSVLRYLSSLVRRAVCEKRYQVLFKLQVKYSSILQANQ